MLVWKLRGHCAYFGLRGNASSLTAFGFHVVHIWQKWLNRRSAAEVDAVEAVSPPPRAVSAEFTPILAALRRFIALHAITDRRDDHVNVADRTRSRP